MRAESLKKFVRRREQCPAKVMIWGCISLHGVGTLAKVDGTITGQEYVDILEDKFSL